jgi:hypothetical protein
LRVLDCPLSAGNDAVGICAWCARRSRQIEILALLPIRDLIGRVAQLGAGARNLRLLDGSEIVDESIAESGAETGIRLQRLDRFRKRLRQRFGGRLVGRVGRQRERQLARDAVEAGMAGVATPLVIAALSWAMTSGGVPAGAMTPIQEPAMKSGTPLSIMVGTSGSSGSRCGVATPSRRMLPSRRCESVTEVVSKPSLIWPPIMSVIRLAAPL